MMNLPGGHQQSLMPETSRWSPGFEPSSDAGATCFVASTTDFAASAPKPASTPHVARRSVQTDFIGALGCVPSLWRGKSQHLNAKAAERTAALHDARARFAHASILAKLLECACLFWRFSFDADPLTRVQPPRDSLQLILFQLKIHLFNVPARGSYETQIEFAHSLEQQPDLLICVDFVQPKQLNLLPDGCQMASSASYSISNLTQASPRKRCHSRSASFTGWNSDCTLLPA